jgi:hypothetical protein
MNAQEILALVRFPLAAPISFTRAIGAVFRALPEQPPSEVFARVIPTPTGIEVEFNPAFRPPELRPTILLAAIRHRFSNRAYLANLLVQGYNTTVFFRELTDQEVAEFQAADQWWAETPRPAYWEERIRHAAEVEVETHCLLARLASKHGINYDLHGALLPHVRQIESSLRARFVVCDDPPGDMFAVSPEWFFDDRPDHSGLKALLVQLSITSDKIEVALRVFA